MASQDGGDRPKDSRDLPVRFPPRTRLSIDPGEFRDALIALHQFGALSEKALGAMENSGVKLSLHSDKPGAVARAWDAIQKELKATSLDDALSRCLRRRDRPAKTAYLCNTVKYHSIVTPLHCEVLSR